MTPNGKATIQDVYAIVNRLEDKMDKRLTILENCVDDNTAFRNKVLGISALAGACGGAVIKAVLDGVKR